MAAYVSNIVIEAGADFNQQFNLEDIGNAPLNLTGYTGASRMKKHHSSLSTAATFTVTFPNRVQGVMQIALTASTTAVLKPGRYVYDVLLSDGSEKTRVIEGSALVTAGITTTV